MLIIGAKGFAKELLEIFHKKKLTKNLCFYDDVNTDIPNLLFGQFRVLKSMEDAKEYFNNVIPNFVIGIGNPKLRKLLFEKFVEIGGTPFTLISDYSEVGSFGNLIKEGVIITSSNVITNDITIKKEQ